MQRQKYAIFLTFELGKLMLENSKKNAEELTSALRIKLSLFREIGVRLVCVLLIIVLQRLLQTLTSKKDSAFNGS